MTISPKKLWVILSYLLCIGLKCAVGVDLIIDKDAITVSPPPDATVKFTARLTEVGDILKAEAIVGGKGASAGLSPVPDGKTSVYFLIDVNEQRGGTFLPAKIKTAKQVADSLAPASSYQIGMGTMGSEFVNGGVNLPEKAARDSFLNAAKSEPTAEIYRCALESLDRIKTQPADRKALVILSSGKSDDKDAKYSADTLITEANKEGVAVFVIGYAHTEADWSIWQSLRRVAKETGGAFIETGSSSSGSPPKREVVRELIGMLKSSKVVTVELKDAVAGAQEMVVKLSVTGGRTLEVRKKIDVPLQAAKPTPEEKAKEEKAKEEKPKEEKPKEEKPKEEKPKEEIQPTTPPWLWPTVIGGGAVLLGLLILLIVKMMRPRRGPHLPPSDFAPPPDNSIWATPENSLPTTIDPTGHNHDIQLEPETHLLVGWLEEIDRSGVRGTRHSIAKSKVSIGRHSDSDLRFQNDSVTSHHATIHLRRDRSLAITDLHSANGTYVNGKRVEHSVLRNEDIIELGEIRLKLVLNQAQDLN